MTLILQLRTIIMEHGRDARIIGGQLQGHSETEWETIAPTMEAVREWLGYAQDICPECDAAGHTVSLDVFGQCGLCSGIQ